MNSPTNNAMDRPIERPWWQKRWAVAGAIALAVCALAAIALSLLTTERTLRIAAERATIATVESGIFHDFVPLRAAVVPRDIIYLDAQEGGRVERVLVQAGDYVEKDQPLVQFGNTDLQFQVIQGELSLIEQINGLRNTEMQLDQTRVANEQRLEDIDYQLVRLGRLAERQNFYFSKGITSAEEREKIVDELEHYQKLRPLVVEQNKTQEAHRLQRVPELRQSLEKLQLNLAITRGKMDNLIVRAPAAGHLTNLDLKIGQNLSRGNRVAEITLDTGFKLSAEIDEYYLSRVHKGQKADVERDDKRLTLTVLRVYPQVKEGRFTVDLDFDGAMPEGLLAGQALQGKLQLGDDRPALLLPAGAFLEETGGDWIFVLKPDGQSAARRRIKIGRRNSEQVEVLGGLTAGERVIVSDYRGFDRIDRIVLTQ